MNKIRLILILSLVCLTACNDLLDEEADSFYDKETYFDSKSKAEMSIYGIYSSLSDLSHYGSCEMAVPASDDMYYTSRTTQDGQIHEMAHYQLTASNRWINNLWTYKYQALDRANVAIEGIRNMSGYSRDESLKRLEAEARFLRAFVSFDLVRYWGDVPYKTTPSSDYESAFQPRTDREEIYDQIVSDLTFAKSHLPWATVADSPERPTQGSARALLMRAFLQRAGYSLRPDGQLHRPNDALRREYFQNVLKEWDAFQQSNHSLYSTYEALFRSFSEGKQDSQESLFEIAFFHAQGQRSGGWWGTYNGPAVAAPSGITTQEAASKYMGRANAFFRVVPEWYDFFEPTDMRRDVVICQYSYSWDANTKQHVRSKALKNNSWYPGKWRREWMPLGYKDPNCTDVNYCSLRYADVILMAAEAYAELGGQDSEAWRLINLVRTRAGATPASTANYAVLYKSPQVYDLPFIADGDSKGKLRTALYWERGFELAFEGQRKFDLLRWGVLHNAILLFGSQSAVNAQPTSQPYPAYRNFVHGKHELFPIPLSEMQSNGKLENENNPGY